MIIDNTSSGLSAAAVYSLLASIAVLVLVFKAYNLGMRTKDYPPGTYRSSASLD